MNYEETKLTEALAICASDDCDGCPYYDFHQCYEQVKRGAHKLIIKQDRTIERLKDDYAKLQELFAQYQMASDKEIKEEVAWDSNGELTDYAREKAYIAIDSAIEFLQENYGAEND